MTNTDKINLLWEAMRETAVRWEKFGGDVMVSNTIRVKDKDVRVTVERDWGELERRLKAKESD